MGVHKSYCNNLEVQLFEIAFYVGSNESSKNMCVK